MKRIIVFCAALTVAACLPASAQKLPATALSLGVLLPSDSDTRHRTGSALLLGELRYALPASASAVSRTVLSGTAATSNRAYEGSTIVSGTVGQVFSLRSGQSPLSPQAVYVGVGAGIYGMDLRFVHAFARFGGYGEIGYNVTSNVFANAQYRLVDRGNGAALSLGVRF